MMTEGNGERSRTNEPTCTNPKCATYPMLYQRTDFDNGRITEIHTCSRCKREYPVVATTLVMLPTDVSELAELLEIVRFDDTDLLAALRDGSEARDV